MKNLIKLFRKKHEEKRDSNKKRGEIAINMSITVLIVMALLSLVISVFPVYTHAAVQNSFANEIARFVEVRGEIDSRFYAEVERLEDVMGLDCDVTYTGTFIRGTSKLQLGDEFTIYVASDTRIGIGGVLTLPVTLKSSAAGRGEKYWK